MEVFNKEPSYSQDPQNSYTVALDAVWGLISTIEEDYQKMNSFRPDRYEGDIHDGRLLMLDTLNNREPHEDGEAFRDYHQLGFMHDALDSVVYAPQLVTADADQRELYTPVFSLGIQLAATKALVRAARDPRNNITREHRSYRSGLGNEHAALALLNRPTVVHRSKSIAVPASRQEDLIEAIDVKWLNTVDPDASVPIQVKGRESAIDRAPKDGVIVYSQTFSREPFEIQNVIVHDHTSKQSAQKSLNRRSNLLAEEIIRLNKPHLIKRQQLQARRALQEMRLQTGYYDLKQNIGTIIPELEYLRDQLTDDEALAS